MGEQVTKGEKIRRITHEITELKVQIERKKEEMEEVF